MDIANAQRTALRKVLLAQGWREIETDRYRSAEYGVEALVEADGQVVIVARAMRHTITFSPAAFVRWLRARRPMGLEFAAVMSG